jgi:hypothetical protein
MPRPLTDPHWRHRVCELSEQKKNAAEIYRQLEEEADKSGRNDYPSDRTVRRIKDAHMAKRPGDRRQYEGFRWPESMGDAEIPWEGSEEILSLIRNHRTMFGLGSRPPIGFTKWFWRVTQAAPTLDLNRRARIAAFLFGNEQNPESVPENKVRSLETFLADEVWNGQWPDYLPVDVLLNGYPAWVDETAKDDVDDDGE